MSACVEKKPGRKEYSLLYYICCNRQLKTIVIVALLAMFIKYIDTVGVNRCIQNLPQNSLLLRCTVQNVV